MSRIKVGVIGMGFMGVSHMEAISRIGLAELVAVAGTDNDLATNRVSDYYKVKFHNNIDELLSDDKIDVVHNCTPNHLHLEVNKKIIKAGKHVFSEKPLATTSDESLQMIKLIDDNKHIVHAVNFNYRMAPLVQEMKNKVINGEIGLPRLIHGSFLQDWLLFDTDYNWRLEPEFNGPSRAIADIGSHWIDCVQTITNSKIIEVCADLHTVLPTRKKPKNQVETFSENTSGEYEEREINTEDYGAVLFRMDNGVHGVFHVSQVSAGRKCYLNFEINGSKASMSWNQETGDHMWMGFRDGDNRQVIRNPNFMTSEARQYTSLPAGHPEGWNDALKNNIHSFYKFILEGKQIHENASDFANFYDGHYIMRIVEAILKSSEAKQWVKIE
jgi:predicted dehydrogenase